MKLRKFKVRLRETGGGEYNMEVVAADEFSATHVAEYSLSEDARARTRVVGVTAVGRG